MLVEVLPSSKLPPESIRMASVPATTEELACSPEEAVRVLSLFTKKRKSRGTVILVSPPESFPAIDLNTNCVLARAESA